MTTNPTQQPDVNADPGGSEAGDVTNDQLRDYARRMKDERDSLRGQVLGSHLQSIGLEADKGLGKAIAQQYDGDATAEAVAAYARSEFSYEPPTQATAADQQAQAQAERQAVIDGVQSQSNPVAPRTNLDRIAELDAKLADPEATRQDAQSALSAKLEQYLEDTRHTR